MKTLFSNCTICDYNGMQKSDLLIEDQNILQIGENLLQNLNQDKIEHIYDLGGKIIMPSFVDVHVHFRDPGFTYKEDLKTGSEAALKGGFTIVNAMANTNPVCDNPKIYNDIMQRAKALDLIDFFQVSALTKNLEGKELVDVEAFPKSLKFVSDDGKDLLTNHMMYEAMKYMADKNIGIMIHAEESEISPYDYRAAEDLITIRDIYLSKRTGAKIHFSHVSTIDSIEAIRQAKKQNLNVSCEITPHHIFFADLDYRVNPPIRKKEDLDALIKAVQDGTIDAIATDHAPHSYEDKCHGAPGMIGLETSFSVCYTQLVRPNHIDLPRLSEIMSRRPAQLLGLDHGEIKEGKRADLVVIDTNTSYIVDENYFQSKSKNSPFIGYELFGQIAATIRRGKIMYGGLN